MDIGLDDLSIGDDDDLPLSRTRDSPTPTSTDSDHSSDSPGNPTMISQASSSRHPHLSSNLYAHPVPHLADSEAIPGSNISSNSSHPIHSSSQPLTNPVRLSNSRQRLTPTPSISMPPPPVIDTELQYSSDNDSMPSPKQPMVGPSPVENEVMAQPAIKGKRKAKAKVAKPQLALAEPSELGPESPNMHKLPKRRSARAGQKPKSRVP